MSVVPGCQLLLQLAPPPPPPTGHCSSWCPSLPQPKLEPQMVSGGQKKGVAARVPLWCCSPMSSQTVKDRCPWFLPGPRPPHNTKGCLAGPYHAVRMAPALTPAIAESAAQSARGGPSSHTLRSNAALREQWPEPPGSQPRCMDRGDPAPTLASFPLFRLHALPPYSQNGDQPPPFPPAVSHLTAPSPAPRRRC